jgi:hypothetical protein
VDLDPESGTGIHHPLFSLCLGLGKTPLTGSSFLDNSYSLAGSEVLLEVGI